MRKTILNVPATLVHIRCGGNVLCLFLSFVIGGVQSVFAQNEDCVFTNGVPWGVVGTATVDVYDPIISEDVDNPMVLDATHTTSVDIQTEQVYRELFISELYYANTDYSNFVYPFGRKMEITTTDALSNYDLNDYFLIFYRVCSQGEFVQNAYSLATLNCYTSVNNTTDITTVAPETAFVVDLPNYDVLNTAAPLNSCGNNSQQLVIALVKAPLNFSNLSLLNLIGINTSDNLGVSKTSGIILTTTVCNTELSTRPVFDDETYTPIKIASIPGDNTFFFLGYNNTWGSIFNSGSNNSLGVVNSNVTTCNYYIPKYNFNSLITPPPTDYRQFYVIPTKISSVGKQEHVLPSQLSIGAYFNCTNTNWNNNLTYPYATQAHTNWFSPLSPNERNVLTMQYAAQKGFEYFRNVHGLHNWWSVYSNYHGKLRNFYSKQRVYSTLSYTSVSPGAIANAGMNIGTGACTIWVVGHELGHNYVSLHISGTWTHEGFADIWGTCIEKYALGLNKPRYLGTSSGVSIIDRSLRSDILFAPGTTNYHVVKDGNLYSQSGSHTKGRLLGHWFYLLSEGADKILIHEKMGQNGATYYKNIPKYVCGIGDELAARIVFKMLDHNRNYESPTYGYGFLVAESIIAVDNLAAIPSEVATYPALADPNYVKAQIRNAWAAVNVSLSPSFSPPSTLFPPFAASNYVGADFIITNNNSALSSFDQQEVKICPGQTLNLSITGYGTEIWKRNGNIVGNGGNLVISNITAADAGIYEAVETYTSPMGATCELVRQITVTVGEVIITANQNPICQNNTLILTALHNNMQQNSLVWSRNGATLASQDGVLTIYNVQPSQAGIYTVTGNCVAPDGTIVPMSTQIDVNVLMAPTSITVGTVQDNEMVQGNATICQGQSIQLYANGGLVNWLNASFDEYGMIAPSSTTTYNVEICNPDCPNLCTNASVTISVNPLPTSSISLNQTDCDLSLTTNNGTEYVWSSGQTTPTIAVTTPDNYVVTVTNSAGCTTTIQQTVSPSQIQPVDFSGDYIVGTTTPALGNRVGDIETWDSPLSSIRVVGKVIIPNGKRLVIKNGTTVEMIGENAGIDVAKNAVLFLKENSVLRGDACSNTCWRGVVVDGDWQVAHPAPITYLASGSINHGLVRIETEGTIRDAKVAVASQSTYTSAGLTTIVAGGIIYVSDANFLNNLVDIKMERQNATVAVAVGGMQRSVITHCEFKKTAPFTCPTTQKYGCISLNSSSSTPTLLIEGNLFTTENLSGEDKGTGIRITNDKVYVQSNNIFQDLFKGIDVFNTLTTIKAVRVVNNQFNNVTKGVTMNNVVGGKIEHNQFNIPSGTSTVDAYGINLFGSKSVHVLDNDFFAAQNSDYARGLIANNTFYDAYPTNVVNNEFNGRFQEATRFSNNDRLLQMQCNSYDACQKDWYFDATAQLDPQGSCFNSSSALRNHFHYIYGAPTLPIMGEHIYIAPGNTFFTTSNKLTLRTDNSPQSLPQNVNNAAIIDADPCFPSGFINTSCTINFPPYEDPMQGCANTNTSNSNLLAAISRMLDTDQTDSLLHLLDCLNTDWAVRLLVGTYTDRGEYAHARELLDVLPNDAENTEFKNIYIAILNELQGNTGGRVTPAKSILEQYSRQRNSRHQTLAESALATYFGFDYVRNIEGEKTQQTTDSALANFTLIPNPAQDMVTIEIPNFTAPVLLRIFDISGREVKQVWLPTAHATIPTQTLGTGIYICKLSDSVGSQKLVIIK